MLGQREVTMEDLTGILRRRWFYIVIPFVLGPLIALGIAWQLPAKYTSTSLVMIEQQRVPDSVVKSVVSENVVARLATMEEQVLSRTRLVPIIEKYNLYRNQYNDDAARTAGMDEMVAQMRLGLTVTPVLSIFGGTGGAAASMRGGEAIPGFYVNFTYSNPKTAQDVCTVITSNFITENLTAREKTAEGTTTFLEAQLQDAKKKLDDQDAKLAQMQKKYAGSLPDEEKDNASLLAAVNTQLDAKTQALNRALLDKSYTESMLAQQLSAWDALKGSGGTHGPTTDQEIAKLEDQLSAMEARYTPDYPEVIKLKAIIEELKKTRSTTAAAGSQDNAKAQPPVTYEPREIQQLRSALHGVDETIAMDRREQAQLTQEAKLYESRMQMSPMVQQEFKLASRDYQTALGFYNDLLAKKNSSGMATDLERGLQGEQFVVLDPPSLPDIPSFPNYWIFAGAGAGGGLALGLAIILALELRDKAIRTERDVEFFLEMPTLMLLPSIGVTNGRKNRRRRWGRKPKPVAEQPVGA